MYLAMTILDVSGVYLVCSGGSGGFWSNCFRVPNLIKNAIRNMYPPSILHGWQRNKPEDDDASICQYVEDIAAITFIGYRSASAMDKK
jgi:hypothetical protein